MDDISSLIEALTQFFNNQNELAQRNHFFTTEKVAVIAALLSVGGLIFTTWYTIRQNSKLQNTKNTWVRCLDKGVHYISPLYHLVGNSFPTDC